jgi:hypothetical protein
VKLYQRRRGPCQINWVLVTVQLRPRVLRCSLPPTCPHLTLSGSPEVGIWAQTSTPWTMLPPCDRWVASMEAIGFSSYQYLWASAMDCGNPLLYTVFASGLCFVNGASGCTSCFFLQVGMVASDIRLHKTLYCSRRSFPCRVKANKSLYLGASAISVSQKKVVVVGFSRKL